MKIQTQHPNADLRKMSSREIFSEQTFLILQIDRDLEKLNWLAIILGTRGRQSISYLRLLDDIKLKFERLSEIIDELEYRRIP